MAAPAPHKGGVVDILETSHGLLVRLDREGRIGRVEYDWRFLHAKVDGIVMGMSLADAARVLPDLEIGDDLPMMRGMREGWRILPDRVDMWVKFTLETVNGIEFTSFDADFPEPTMPLYTLPSGDAGAPFAETNFKLVVLSSLLDAKVLDFGTPENLATYVLARPVDLEHDGYERSRRPWTTLHAIR